MIGTYMRQIWLMERNGDIMDDQIKKLTLTLDADKITGFFPLLQKGFRVNGEVGISIKTLLCKNLGLDPDYVDGRIKTLFLDGKAVDDPDSAIIWDGSTLALSAAMPGLVGATLRRGGYLAPFRNEITYIQAEGTASPSRGTISLKLFNAILKDLGQDFLHDGICVSCSDLVNLFKRFSEDYWTNCRHIDVDGKTLDQDDFLEMKWVGGDELVLLRIESGD